MCGVCRPWRYENWTRDMGEAPVFLQKSRKVLKEFLGSAVVRVPDHATSHFMMLMMMTRMMTMY